jgi:hypothetical protein
MNFKNIKNSFRKQVYKFTCLPNGLACAPRLFTKLLKPIYSTFLSQGYLSVGYIDDSYLQGDNWQECYNIIQATINLFSQLGFIVHPEKSVMAPSQKLNFLGFIVNSNDMTVYLPVERANSLKEAAKKLLLKQQPTIRELAKVIGKIVAVFPGSLYGPLHYRRLEQDKIMALKKSRGDYDTFYSAYK